MVENEYRVRAVTRYIVTHFTSNGVNAGSETFGEFPNIQQADTVGKALSAADPGSTFQTIEDRREPSGIFYTYTQEQGDALMRFLFSKEPTNPGAPLTRSDDC